MPRPNCSLRTRSPGGCGKVSIRLASNGASFRRVTGIGNSAEFLGPANEPPSSPAGIRAGDGRHGMKDTAAAVVTTVQDPPLIGSGSQEEADSRVQALLTLGTSRGFLTYEELNEKLPDEVVSPDKLDSLLMMIDEMGIKLIDEADIGEYQKQPRVRKKTAAQKADEAKEEELEDEGEEIDLNLEAELAEASTKRIDDPVRM